MTQLFYESFEDAARDVIKACGGTKDVAHKLWPAKSADAARTRLLDCLNVDRADKLAPDEILMLSKLGRAVGCHALAIWFNQEAGYAPPVPVDAEDQKAELQRKFAGAVAELGSMLKRIERVSA